MEGTMDLTSNTSNKTAAASPTNNHQQGVVVSSLTIREQAASNTNKKKLQVAQQVGDSKEVKSRPVQDVGLKCPRCSSKNTKFCYYNNYKKDQPRYSCKACRRYWTQGGSLRLIPIGNSRHRNKCTSAVSSSSLAASSTTATSAEVEKTVTTRLMLTVTATSAIMPSMPHSPTTGLLFPNSKLPTFTPTGGSAGLGISTDGQQHGFVPFEPLSLPGNQAPEELAPGGSDTTPTFAMDKKHGFLPSKPLSLSNDQGFLPFEPLALFDAQALEELAPGGSDTTPTFLEMLTGGYFDVNFPGYPTYGDGPTMSGGSNGMDMSFLMPDIGMGGPTTDPMLEGMNDVASDLKWASSELDNYFNNDGGYATGPGVEVEQKQQVVGDQQQDEDDNKVNESSKNNNHGDGGSSKYSYSYWINNTTNNDGAEG